MRAPAWRGGISAWAGWERVRCRWGGAAGGCVLWIAPEAIPKSLPTHPRLVVGSGSYCSLCTPLPAPFSSAGERILLCFGAALVFGVLPVGGWPERVLCWLDP